MAIICYFLMLLDALTSENCGNGYVTLCDATEAMVLCAKGHLLQVTTDNLKFKYTVK